MWPLEQARRWQREHSWPVGCTFIPSTAINQLEMWQPSTFDLATIDKELRWASSLGFNSLRVYLHDLLWEADPTGLIGRMHEFLAAADHWGMKVLFVFFDDCWRSDFAAGVQPDPMPGRHNSGWVQSPGKSMVEAFFGDRAVQRRLHAYVNGVITAFRDDPRILGWDLYNEPGGKCRLPDGSAHAMGDVSLALLDAVFDWAAAIQPSQPVTSALFTDALVEGPLPEVQVARSDILSFHCYGDAAVMDRAIAMMQEVAGTRPVWCTEYLARGLGSRFETHLPRLKEAGFGAFSWGLVAGKTQTHFPWSSWERPQPEPGEWFHDIFRWDGSPFDNAELACIRSLTWHDAVIQEFLETV